MAEVEVYRRAETDRWFRERVSGEGGAASDSFERLQGLASRFDRVRKRDDEVRGFLSPAGRCRLHEKLRGRRTAAHVPDPSVAAPRESGGAVVTASFSCPTVVAHVGRSAGEQRSALRALQAERNASLPEPEPPVRLSRRRKLPGTALRTLHEVLLVMLGAPRSPGGPDLRCNVGGMARMLEDLSRHRAQRLADERLSEYVEPLRCVAARSPCGRGRPVASRG